MKEETGKERGCLGFGGRAWPDSKALKFAVDEVTGLAPATSVSPVADYFRLVGYLLARSQAVEAGVDLETYEVPKDILTVSI